MSLGVLRDVLVMLLRDNELVQNFSGESLRDNINLEEREGDGRIMLGMHLKEMV
jgi:hypothetical protein